MGTNIKDWLTKQERNELLRKSNRKGAWLIIKTLGIIFFAFLLPILWPSLPIYIISCFLLGGRQLACAIIMHDTSHNALFTSKKMNERVGKWLGAYPIFNNFNKFRPYHLAHHVHLGTDEDPDILLSKGYPVSTFSLLRKFMRDITGITGIKSQIAFTLMQLELITFNLGKKIKWIKNTGLKRKDFLSLILKNFGGPVIVNIVLFYTLYLFGFQKIYFLWIISFLTTYPLFLRIRSISEHALLEGKNGEGYTRTTYANFIERLFFAPHFVNYHAEHHLLMTVPPYNLPKMHKLILSKGFYKDKNILEKNYLNLLRKTKKISY